MAELVWNEGMSVGVEAIDNDHKKIITILSRLIASQNSQDVDNVINQTFSELEHYIVEHFSREEALLEQFNYKKLDAHKDSHKKFVEKVAQLKQQWLENNTREVRSEITDYLQHWLLKHILQEDQDYVGAIKSYQKIESYQQIKKAKHPLLRFLAKKLAQNVSLSKRVFITTLSPLVMSFAFCFMLLSDSFQRYQNVSLIIGLHNVIEQVNGISHSMQAERGLSSGYSSSNFQDYADSLSARRAITDDKIKNFLLLLNLHLDETVKDNIYLYAESARESFTKLNQVRLLLDKGIISGSKSNEAYTQLIEQLLYVSESLIHLDVGSELSNDIAAINAILSFKEYMGQMRAIGMGDITQEAQNLLENKDIIILLGKQLSSIKSFNNAANDQQKLQCADYCDEKLVTQIIEQYYMHIVSKHELNDRSDTWFVLMSQEIDNIKLLSDKLIAEFSVKVQAESKQIENKFFWVAVVLTVFLVVSILFALVLNYSIINPVRKLTYALDDMSAGQTNIQFKHALTNDEIGAMQLAYEKLRRRLLQADIYKARVSDQQKEIQYRKSQQDHFEQLALTDALTGAVNRHHFNDLLGKEIANVNQHGRPLSIMILDIDHFKSINDTYGHTVGDQVLKIFYQACKDAVRSSDVVARVGGEEFVIVMPDTNLNNAKHFAERLRSSVEQLAIQIEHHLISVTVSIGVSQWHPELFINAETFIAHADNSLYQAKNTGRNKVVIAEAPSA